jgi:hypothetical protein
MAEQMHMNQGSNLAALLILASVLTTTGCGSEAPTVVERKDPWYQTPPPSEMEPEIVPRTSYIAVVPERIAEAEEFLTKIGTSQISPGEVPYFTGREMPLPDVTRPFLVRGLYRTNPSHTVRIVGHALWVSSDDDPSDTAPLKRQPLVLIMQEVPELVYVTTGK